MCWGREGAERFPDAQGLALGECRAALIELSVGVFVNALSLTPPALLVASVVVRWLLYNVHSPI